MKLSRITALTTVAAAALTLAAIAATPTLAQMTSEKTVTVGGAPMYPTKNIIQNAVNSKDHTTLVAAVKVAGLVDTLSGAGPFTVFAPTNEAFAALPAGTLDSLLKPENKSTLTSILTYHVVSGPVFAKDVKAGGVMTVNGAKFTVAIDNGSVLITDGKGNKAKIVKTDISATNGVIHVIDAVLLP